MIIKVRTRCVYKHHSYTGARYVVQLNRYDNTSSLLKHVYDAEDGWSDMNQPKDKRTALN